MSDAALADEIILRLNKLIEDPEVRADVGRLLETRILVSSATAGHRSIQVQTESGSPVLGFLGLLNGLVGTIPTGEYRYWGFIAVELDDNGQIVRFRRTGG